MQTDTKDWLVSNLFVGDMGVKEIYVGDIPIYQRQGGYFYLELSTEEEST